MPSALKSNPANTRRLYKAVKNGSLAEVKACIEDGISIETSLGDGDTPLTLSLAQEDVEIAQFLVDQGANVNAKGRNRGGRFKALSLVLDIWGAFEQGTAPNKLLKSLVQKGARFQGTSMGNTNILHLTVCEYKNAKMFRFFLDHVQSLEELQSYKNSKGVTLETSVYSTGIESIIKAYIEKAEDLKAQGLAKENTHSTTKTDALSYVKSSEDVMEVVQNLSDGRGLLDIFNFAFKRVTTELDGTLTHQKFSDFDIDVLEDIEERLVLAGGKPNPKWRDAHPDYAGPKKQVVSALKIK